MTTTPVQGRSGTTAPPRSRRGPRRPNRNADTDGRTGTLVVNIDDTPRRAGGDDWTLAVDLRVNGTTDPVVADLVEYLRSLVSRADPVAQPAGGPHVRIDVAARTVTVAGRYVEFTRREFDLLLYLADNPGRTYARDHLLREVWGSEQSGPRTIDVHVRRIRAKAFGCELVTTVHSVGYRLAAGTDIAIVRR